MNSQKQMIALLKATNPSHYQKSGIYNYILCDKEQEVITQHSGQVEVKNTALPGDYILTDTQGGLYAVKPEVFAKRYEVINEKTAKAKGQCWATQWSDAPSTFESPWKAGEEMIIEPGDYLASPDDQFTEVYRIKKEEFETSYTLVEAVTV